VLAACELELSKMPQLVEGSAPSANIRSDVAAALGFDGLVVVAGGAGDAAASAIGIGAVEVGDAFVSLGTSMQLFVTDERYHPQPGTLLHAFAHALPERWFRMAAMLNGASCLEFVARLLGELDIAALLQRTEAQYRGPSRLLSLPYLTGERTPHNNPFARGVFSGLDHNCGPTDLTQAALEGVAFSLLEAGQLMDRAGVKLASIAAVGGGVRSRFWMQIISDVTGLPVVRYRGSETGPAFGAARLARIALTSELAGDVCAKPVVLDVLQPRAEVTDAYSERFKGYRALYRELRPHFASASSLTGSP
jgi:xylulokinase